MKPVGFAVIGCGDVGKRHLRSLGAIRRFALVVAVCDVEEKCGREVAGMAKVPFYSDPEDLLALDDVEVVDICTPPSTHLKIAMNAMDEGRHVFCEEPLATNSKDAQAMWSHAKACKALFGVGFCHRYQPGIQTMKKVVDSGRIGKVIMFRNRFSCQMDVANPAWRWRVQPRTSGGGNLWDTGIHSIDMVRYLVGEFKKVRPVLKSFSNKIRNDVEDTYIVGFETTKGVIGTIEGSWVSPYAPTSVEVYGTKGAALYNYDEDKLVVHTAAGPSYPKIPPGDRFATELKSFAMAVRNEHKLEVTGKDGVFALRVVEEILEAYKAANATERPVTKALRRA